MCVLVVVFSVLPTVMGADPFSSNGGYSTVWLLILFIIGTYIRKYGEILKTKGSMSIVGVEPKKNNFRIVSERLLRHDFYVLQKRILFLKLEKLRIPYDTRFKTLVLLLQPSM